MEVPTVLHRGSPKDVHFRKLKTERKTSEDNIKGESLLKSQQRMNTWSQRQIKNGNGEEVTATITEETSGLLLRLHETIMI